MTINEKAISEFIKKEEPKLMTFLRATFSCLNKEDCQDVIQDSYMALWEASSSGALTGLNAPLSLYLRGICKNQALIKIRKRNSIGWPEPICDSFCIKDTENEMETINKRLDELIYRYGSAFDGNTIEDDPSSIVESIQEQSLLRRIVANLPEPCNTLLWAFYRDGFSMQMIASLYHYASDGVARFTTHKCRKKLSERLIKESTFISRKNGKKE